MRIYKFKIIVEQDKDKWIAYSPLLKEKGGATWGYTKEEALKNINEVLEMVVESMIGDGETIPELEIMIEDQAKWTEDDLIRLGLLK